MANIKSFPNNQDVYIGAEEVMKWHHGRSSGVFGADGNAAVQALTPSEMAVTVTDGTGWISNSNGDGVVWWNDEEASNGAKLKLIIDAADGVLNRIDRVIVEWETTNYVAYPQIKILKGSASSNASAPALTNNSTVRQISLARISVAAGITAITSSMITDERLDTSVCGLVTDKVSVDTSTMNAQFNALLSSIQNELSDLESGTGVELKKLLFNDVSVAASDFVDDTTHSDFPYRAAVALTGVVSTMIPDVVLPVEAATSGNFAPVCECYNGGVYLYAASAPDTDITIPTIICWKGA